ncbi:MAG: hypothetical protein GC151_20040 [Betaproteobacteria bacterium]|nr:hypothetical protein [Betaproteobacteria bacterium]
MSISRFVRCGVAGAVLFGVCAGSALAIPQLQLGIAGGTYDMTTQTTIAPTGTNSFTVYAYLAPPNRISSWNLATLLNDTYYISVAALINGNPVAQSAGSSYGSFTAQVGAGSVSTIAVTDDMVYGTPPVDLALATGGTTTNNTDLQAHGVFPTYFTSFGFKFTSAQMISPFDAQTTVGADPTTMGSCSNTWNKKCMYYVAMNVDISGLTDPNLELHFDLYDTAVKNCSTTITINDFAPFSHDAQSNGCAPGTPGCGNTPSGFGTPEPAALALIGVAVLSAGWARRRPKGKTQA